MRATILLLALAGALSMSDIASGDDKKKEKEFPELKKGKDVVHNETVTVRVWNEQAKTFSPGIEKVKAARFTNGDKRLFMLDGSRISSRIPVGSEIIDTDGNVYVSSEKGVPVGGNESVRIKPPAKP